LRGIGSLAAIEGICYRADGKTVHTRPRTPIADLDALPFPDYRFLSDAASISRR
jgi:hypothetical protein